MIAIDEMLTKAQDTLTARRVFGEPVTQDGMTVLPAANVVGGGGGGGGHSENGEEGSGGGFGIKARAAGVYVIDQGKVHWQPAVDVNRLASTVAAVLVASMFFRWRLAAIRARASGE